MPLDGICMQAVAEELRPELLGLRIDNRFCDQIDY